MSRNAGVDLVVDQVLDLFSDASPDKHHTIFDLLAGERERRNEIRGEDCLNPFYDFLPAFTVRPGDNQQMTNQLQPGDAFDLEKFFGERKTMSFGFVVYGFRADVESPVDHEPAARWIPLIHLTPDRDFLDHRLEPPKAALPNLGMIFCPLARAVKLPPEGLTAEYQAVMLLGNDFPAGYHRKPWSRS
jgi:hypothetical protein